MDKIKQIHAREVLDSRANPTVEVEICTESGIEASAIVPSGASTGVREALELRDNDSERYNGKGVLNAVENVKTKINDLLVGEDITNQTVCDQKMLDFDGSDNKANLGANAILGVSMALAQAAAKVKNVPLFIYLNELYGNDVQPTMPVPMMNILNGGAHANNSLDIQEFMIIPHSSATFSTSLRMGVEIFHSLKKQLDSLGHSIAVGDEGGFAPSLKSNDEAIDLILTSIQKAGYEPGKDVGLALDVAASELFENNLYAFKGEDRNRDLNQMVAYYAELVNKYPILSIEDGLSEDDWKGWKALTTELGDKVQLVGDDLFVTNERLLKEGIDQGVANSILIKLNQIGTVTETMNTIKLAQDSGFGVIVSHRSGESEDTFISDLAVATAAGQIKTGSLCRTDRTAKYNQLLRLEEKLLDKALFKGKEVFTYAK